MSSIPSAILQSCNLQYDDLRAASRTHSRACIRASPQRHAKEIPRAPGKKPARSSISTASGSRSASGLMLISRLAGLVAPFSTKYLMDDVIAQQPWELLPKLALAVGVASLIDAACSFANSQVLGRRRPARHHRNAQGHRGARDAPADPLLRLDENRRPHLADHDRRRRHPESRRHRHRAADRIDRVGRHRARRPALSQLEADRGDDPHPRHLRRRDGDGRSSGCGRCSASAARSTRR